MRDFGGQVFTLDAPPRTQGNELRIKLGRDHPSPTYNQPPQEEAGWQTAVWTQFSEYQHASTVHVGLQALYAVWSTAPQTPVVTELVLGLSRTEFGGWVAIDRLVGHFGEGATCEEAVRDLLVTLSEDRDLLRERAEQLSPAMVRQLALLEAIPDELL